MPDSLPSFEARRKGSPIRMTASSVRQDREADSARRYRVIGKIDLEQAGIHLPGGIQIVDRNCGVIALRVGHRPLLELAVLAADHQHQASGPDQRLLLLDG